MLATFGAVRGFPIQILSSDYHHSFSFVISPLTTIFLAGQEFLYMNNAIQDALDDVRSPSYACAAGGLTPYSSYPPFGRLHLAREELSIPWSVYSPTYACLEMIMSYNHSIRSKTHFRRTVSSGVDVATASLTYCTYSSIEVVDMDSRPFFLP